MLEQAKQAWKAGYEELAVLDFTLAIFSFFTGVYRPRAAQVRGVLTPTSATVRGAAAQAEQGGLNLFKKGNEQIPLAGGWRTGDRMLYLPDQGSPKLNWQQNAGRLRAEMRQGQPIFDSYRDPVTGLRIESPNSFLNMERNLLESRGWQYNPQTGAYHPPVNPG